jgi:hypothetical protein
VLRAVLSALCLLLPPHYLVKEEEDVRQPTPPVLDNQHHENHYHYLSLGAAQSLMCWLWRLRFTSVSTRVL